jgi:hypothetical protein
VGTGLTRTIMLGGTLHEPGGPDASVLEVCNAGTRAAVLLAIRANGSPVWGPNCLAEPLEPGCTIQFIVPARAGPYDVLTAYADGTQHAISGVEVRTSVVILRY